VKKPQEGSQIRRGVDIPGGTSTLRGAPRSPDREGAREHAWVDAELLAWSAARAMSKARGRRQVTGPAASVWDKPWRGREAGGSRSEGRSESRGERGDRARGRFESAQSEKGTAMVAKGASFAERDPRPRGGGSRGSSGGQAARGSSDQSNRRLGARLLAVVRCSSNEPQERSEVAPNLARSSVEKSAKGVETSKAQRAEVGSSARRRGESGLLAASGRCVRSETLKGKETP
jgi:hypothetical protein